MKTSLLLFFATTLFLSQLEAQEDPFISDFSERLENSKKYLLLIAKTMPEKQYNYKASDGSLSFAEHLMHIGFALDWHSQSLIGDRAARDYQTDTVYKVANKSKDEMMRIIENTFDNAQKVVNEFNIDQLDIELDYFGLQRSKRQIFMLLADHITHHRGQMLVYMRLNGLVPPRYVLFQ